MKIDKNRFRPASEILEERMSKNIDESYKRVAKRLKEEAINAKG